MSKKKANTDNDNELERVTIKDLIRIKANIKGRTHKYCKRCDEGGLNPMRPVKEFYYKGKSDWGPKYSGWCIKHEREFARECSRKKREWRWQRKRDLALLRAQEQKKLEEAAKKDLWKQVREEIERGEREAKLQEAEPSSSLSSVSKRKKSSKKR